MTLVEFAEKISPIPLTDWQKKFLSFYEQAEKEHKKIVCIMPRINGRKMIIDIIREYEKRMKN